MRDSSTRTSAPAAPQPPPPPRTRPVVFYRDRTAKEIRDIRWEAPPQRSMVSTEALLADDQWIVPGCPVNGPSVASCESHLAVSRFTAADDQPKVILEVHPHKDPSHKREIVLDDQAPLGAVPRSLLSRALRPAGWGARRWHRIATGGSFSKRTLTHEQILTQLKGPIFRGRTCAISKNDTLWVTWTDQRGVHLGRIRLNG